MAQEKDLSKVNMGLTLMLWSLLCGISMAVMLFAASRKVIVITDAGQVVSGTEEKPEILPEGALKLTEQSDISGQLVIPLEAGMKAENVVMENHYMDREVWIYIRQAQYSFYEENAVWGEISRICDARYEAREDGVILKFVMTEVLEYHSTLENAALKLTFFRPREQYEQIVVIDALTDGITAGVAKQLQKSFAEPEIKLYFVQTESVKAADEKSIQLVEELQADYYLRLGLSENTQDSSLYGICSIYNEEYFIPGFGSVQWADIVTRKVVIASSNRAIGLQTADEDSILKKMKIPAAQINLGFVTNQQEAALLLQESYQEKLAQGIAEAIREAYTKNKKEKQQVEEFNG